MASHILQDIPFPAEIFHELARQFDGIPFHAVNAGNAKHIDLGQQMMQAMSELVEQCDDFVMREESRLCTQGCREIAIQVRDRDLYAGMYAPACYCIIHPSSTALGRPRINIEIKLPYQRSAA